MKKTSLIRRLGRRGIYSIITVLLIAVLLAGNVALAYLGQNKMIFADLTPEGLYTLTDAMKKECAFVEELKDAEGNPAKVEILFCTDPDYLIDSTITRLPYFMSLALANTFDNITLDTVNVSLDPTAVAAYKTTSLTEIEPGDIIVSFGGRYRIVSAETFWTTDSDGKYWSYNGEYKMATLIKSLTAVERPSAYFVTNHGETYYDVNDPQSEKSLKAAVLYDLLTERGLEVKTLSLSEEDEIPEDCVLLIINNPREDFTYDEDKLNDLYHYTETDKLDRYLVRDEGAIMVTKDYELTLPVFEEFMHEWGFDFSTSLVKDETAGGGALTSTGTSDGLGTDIIGVYNTDEDSYANAIYGEFAALSSAPRFVISNTGYITCTYKESAAVQESGNHAASRNYSSFFSTSATARAYAKNENGEYTGILEADKGAKDVAVVATRLYTNSTTAEYNYSYMFAANSPDFLSNETLGNPSYANYDVVSALVNNLARVDVYGSMDLGGISQNSSSFGGKQLTDTSLSEVTVNVYSPDASEIVKVNRGISTAEITVFSVIVFALPVAALIVGIVVRIKRKFL